MNKRVGRSDETGMGLPSTDETATSHRENLRTVAAVTAGGVVLAVVIFLIPSGRMTDPVVKLITGLIWPYMLTALAIVFRPQVKALLLELVTRVKRGSSVELGIFKLGSLPEQAQRIPAPSSEQRVTLKNIALLHTSFLSEEATLRLGHGERNYYQFEVVVMAPDAVMKRIQSVTYYLEETWPEKLRIRTIEDRNSRFKMKDLANGTSIVSAEVRFRDEKEPLHLNRFIDLRTDGPRI